MLRSIFLIVFIFLSTSNLNAEVLYWVGGTGDYNDSTHWSLTSGGVSCGKRPTLLDDVYFDQNSFSEEGQIVTVSTKGATKNVDWSHARFNPIWKSQFFTVGGNFILSPKMKIESGNFTFISPFKNNKLVTYGIEIDANLSFDNEKGEWLLQDDLLCKKTLSLISGVLNTNAKHLKINKLFCASKSKRELVITGSKVEINTIDAYENSGWELDTTNLIFKSENSELNFTNTSVINLGDKLQYNRIIFHSDVIIKGNVKIRTAIFKENGKFVKSNSIDSLILTNGKSYTFNYLEVNEETIEDLEKYKGIITISAYLKAEGSCQYPIQFKSGILNQQVNVQISPNA